MMRPILVVIGFVALALACDDGWESFGDSCYKFDNTDRNYDDSEAFCIGEGAHLVSIHNDEENDFVIDKSRELGMGPTWIGLDDRVDENSFTYLDGTEFYRGGYTNAEPNDWGGGQDCSYFPFRERYGWDDMRCTNTENFVCESSSSPCRDGWEYLEITGHCYKWYSDRFPYDQAKQRCSGDGGYLVSITSPAENTFVVDLALEISGQSDMAPSTWIGLDDEQEEGKFTLVELGSNSFLGRFSRGEPNNHGGRQDCIWFPFRGVYRWDDVDCNALRKAVCKKPSPEAQFGDLTVKSQAIMQALLEGCTATGVSEDQNLCEKIQQVFDELVNVECAGSSGESE